MSHLKMLAARFEAASQHYAVANGIARNDEWFLLKLQEELGELTQVWMKWTGRGRAKGRTPEELRGAVEDEAADVLGHILLLAHRHGLDLDAAIRRKWYFDPQAG
jgi:NTP pyrophosphatase (non-canonical NTP hydrolase)